MYIITIHLSYSVSLRYIYLTVCHYDTFISQCVITIHLSSIVSLRYIYLTVCHSGIFILRQSRKYPTTCLSLFLSAYLIEYSLYHIYITNWFVHVSNFLLRVFILNMWLVLQVSDFRFSNKSQNVIIIRLGCII